MDKLTETRNPKSYNIDTMSIEEIITLMNNEDYLVLKAVENEKKNISKLIEQVVIHLKNSGSLFYIGAGTSGRLGVLDAVECPPTYGVSPNLVQAILAGGEEAFTQAIEGAEDSEEMGAHDISVRVKKGDIVVGIASSGTTPYVIGGLKKAKELGIFTSLICCNKINKPNFIDILISLLVGPEVITGSTRLKAGTATKMVLNMISTISMIKLGKVYENLMVDLQVTNEKLYKRAINIIKTLTTLNDNEADNLLKKANNRVKVALAMYFLNTDYDSALRELDKCNGFLREIIKRRQADSNC